MATKDTQNKKESKKTNPAKSNKKTIDKEQKSSNLKKSEVKETQVTSKKVDEETTPKEVKREKFSLKIKVRTIVQVGIVVALMLLFFLKPELFIAADVNGQPVTRIALLKELETSYGKQTLETLITKKLIFQEAKEKNIEVTQEDLDAKYTELESAMAAQSTDLSEFLKQQGMTREELNEELKIQIIVEKSVADQLTVTDEEINTYIESSPFYNPDEEVTPEMKEQVAEALKQQKGSAATQQWLQEIRSRSNITNHLYPETTILQ